MDEGWLLGCLAERVSRWLGDCVQGLEKGGKGRGYVSTQVE